MAGDEDEGVDSDVVNRAEADDAGMEMDGEDDVITVGKGVPLFDDATCDPGWTCTVVACAGASGEELEANCTGTCAAEVAARWLGSIAVGAGATSAGAEVTGSTAGTADAVAASTGAGIAGAVSMLLSWWASLSLAWR